MDAARREHAHRVARGVGHEEVAVGVEGQGAGPTQPGEGGGRVSRPARTCSPCRLRSWPRRGCRWRRRPGPAGAFSPARGGDGAVRRVLAHRVAAGVGDVDVAIRVEGQGAGSVQRRCRGSEGRDGAVRREHANRVATVVGHVEIAVSVEGQRVGPAQPGEGGGGGGADRAAIGADDGRRGRGVDVDVGARAA